MKKEENVKPNPTRELNKIHDYRSRSHSPKAYLGCDTCKLKSIEMLKKNKSMSKFSDCNSNVDKNKVNKFRKTTTNQEKDDPKKGKIKLTDLCDDDKKRIIDLIEELSKFAEKNQKLKDMLERMQTTRQEQQDYIMKQANLHLEEKNFYANEISEYKTRVESLENDLKNKNLLWEKQERAMEKEIAYLAKSLQESVNEKTDLNEQINHLKICLRQSLESFQRLRTDIAILQQQEKLVKQFKSMSCQTEGKFISIKDKFLIEDFDLDDELFSLSNQNTVEGKSSLDVINDKLEHVYQLLKKKSEIYGKCNPQKFDIDLSILLRNEKLKDDDKIMIDECKDDGQNDESERNSSETGYKFLKPFNYCSKTSVQAERILKKIGKPFSSKDGKSPVNSPRNHRKLELEKGENRTIIGKVIQQNNLLDIRQCNEDRLLEDLFYTDGNLKLDLLESASDENGKKMSNKF